ncbi:CoA transferase [Wenzhouxiangella sp. AB-CW3]|uniref:CaiB/BaiF CoA transferase family protein n=1 Tax=Wenzhouxiangella sp. AB-CW3 TaxID=2771012 RepID=UPI00168A94CA|nr:CoA transferase [Wenzhouxiangella sp. AB-CW3]QOC22336.1 CoA transferase [Wenzhouxiangella sp. AB-CW3]
MSGPLSGVRVLELSRILAGPWAGQILADFGAEVIKIERPGAGDDTRGWGPPWLRDDAGHETGESAYFLSTNRGKRSVAINLAEPRGQELVRELACKSDVLIENFRVGGLARYGLDWASLRELHPGLVFCSITGFGQDGPRAHQSGYDAAIQAMGGLMSITGEPDGGPQKVGVAVADLMAGMYAVSAIQAALLHSWSTGQGQHIDLSLLDTQVAWLANQAANYLIGGQVPGRQGTAHPNIVPYQAFACADGHLMLAVGNDAQFERFARLAGHPDWIDDERFRRNHDRVAHRTELIAAIEPVIAGRAVSDWLETLADEGIPAAPINSLDAVFDDPQVRQREMVRPMDHPLREGLPLVANPVRFSATPVDYRQAPPLLGADTRNVLRECLALEEEYIETLLQAGVVAARPD